MRLDLGISKKFDLPGRFTFEFRGEMLNALNEPVLQSGVNGRHAARLHDRPSRLRRDRSAGGTPTANTTGATNVDNYRLTELLGDNQSRHVQLVWRLRW